MKISAIEQKILKLLCKERQFLINADFDSIANLSGEKEDLLSTLLQKHELNALDRITIEAKRNDRLYAACLSGLKSGIKQIEDIRQNTGKLNTYTDSGSISNKVEAVPTISIKS